MPLHTALIALALAYGSVTDFEDMSALDRRIGAVTNGATTPIDRRIKLARCPEPAMIEPMVNGSITIRCPALGWRLRVSVAVSQTESAQVLVRRGESIEVVYPGNGFSISGMGLALDDGEEGKSVRVKISTSAAPVTAIVTGAGVATVSH